MFQPKSFGGVIRPVLLLHFLLGIGSPAHIMKQKVKKSAEIVYTVWNLALIHLVLYHQYCSSMYFKQLDLSSAFSCIWMYCSYVITLVFIIGPRFNEENVQDMITVFEEIDQKMDTIGLPKQYWSQCKYQMFTLCWWLVYVSALATVEWCFTFTPFIPVFDKILLSLTVNVVPILTVTTYLSFSIWIRYIQTKFSQLNYLMEEMIDSSGPKRFLQITECQIEKGRCMNFRLVKGNVQIIMKAEECHLQLIRIAKRVNKYFGVNLLLSLVTTIVIIMGMLYAINFSMWYSLSGDDLFMDTFPLVIVTLLYMTSMAHLYYNCMHTSNEAGKLGYLLCRLYDSATSMKFRIEVQRFTQQVQQNPLLLNICGLVDIDDTFLTSTVGWVFTYIVVILQLQTQNMQQKLDANSTSVVTPAI